MKHLRLFETQKEYQDDILIGSVSDFPMVTYAQNDDALDYFNVPIVKTKVEMIEAPAIPITNHLSIKKLTVDGEIMWEKDTWIEKKYEISQDDFIPDESDNIYISGHVLFTHYDLFNELDMGGKNILIKSDDNPTHFLVIVPYDGEYATTHITGEIYNIEEYIDEFSIKKIDDNTYDVSNFYSHFARLSSYQFLILLANENAVIPQTLTYERLGTEAENEVQSMEVTQDNVFTNLVNQGFVATIYGEIDTMDYLGVIFSMNGEILNAAPIPIEEIVGMGLGTLVSNKFSFDLSALATELGGIDASYCLLDKEIANVSGGSWSDMPPYVKDATVTWASFSYITALPVGQHEVEIELASYKHLPLMNPNVLTEMDLSSLRGQFVDTVGVCSGAENLTKIIFPENLPNIGNHAFDGCTSLTEVVIPNTVTSIGDSAFEDCKSLSSVTLGNSVTSIGILAFHNCDSLTSITIPDSVTSIGNNAFYGCTNLNSVNLGNGVTTIGSGAFNNCESLSSITIPNSVTSLGGAFSGCSSLTSVTIGSGVTSIGDTAFQFCEKLDSVHIGSGVTSIGFWAFRNCTSLTEIILPDSVTSIGSGAFSSCSSLTSVTFGSGVASISDSAFDNTPFYDNLPDGEVYLGKCYYMYKGSMPSNTSIVIKDGTKGIGYGAFDGCKSLTEVVIPNTVTTIGERAFRNCTSLTEVVIPDSVTSIGNTAFNNCSRLRSITIGSGVTSIGSNQFTSCKNLTTITCYATTAPTLSYSIFVQISTNGILRVPSGSDYSSWLSALPSGWTIEYLYKPTVCTNLTIKANNVSGRQTKTQITYTAITNGYHTVTNEPIENVIITGVAESNAFEQNTSYTDTIEREITFEFMGVTASTTITQGVWRDQDYLINLNDQWRKSDTVLNPDSDLYDGVYESFSNFNVNSSTATCTITINEYNDFKLYVRSYAESSYDYVIVYDLDSTTVQKVTTKGNQQSGTALSSYTLVEFNNINYGEHTITIEYRKDNSQNSGADRGYLLIPFEQ